MTTNPLPQAPSHLPLGTILAVDDRSESLALLVRILTQAGYQVHPADSGELALAAVAANPPDLILLDVRMKGVDGLDVCRRLKANDATRHVPIILMSAFADVKEWVEGLQLGAVDYITKPFRAEELLARVKTHLALTLARVSIEQQAAALGHANVRLQSEMGERQRIENDLRQNLDRAERSRRAILSTLEDQKRAEEALHTSEAQLSNALQMAHAGHWEYEVGSDTFTFNDNFYRIFRTTAAEAGGYKMSSADYARRFCHPDDAAAVGKETQAAIEATDPNFSRQLEHRILYADGKVGHMAVRFFIVKDQQGRTVKTYGVNQDITERKLGEEALRKSNKELQAALQELRKTQKQMVREERLSALGQMASGIAHDFNNVLVPIVGYSEILISQPDTLADHDTALSMLKDISSAARDAKQIVQRLRLIRGSEDESMRLPVNMSDIVRSAVEMTRPRWDKEMGAQGNRINVVTPPGSDKRVLGIESELREALINLILNAVDAMPKGGTLTITSSARDNNVVVEVIDAGTGMTDEAKEHYLEPFFTTKGVKGTGLGLSMVHGIVTRHNGTMEIDSTLGKGTTVRILLPCVPAESIAEENKKAKTEEDFTIAPIRILVADDEMQSRSLIERFLKKDGHSVETARDGRDAMDKASAGTFDLVITDRSMPEANGDLVALSVKTRNPQTPVILLTGFGDIMKDENERPVGVDRVLGKPVTCQDLRKAISEVMGKRSAEGGRR